MTSKAYKDNYNAIDWSDFKPTRRWRHSIPKARSDFPLPLMINDSFDEPVQSQADGKFYTSKAALRATYRADGNPQGIEYIEVGNERPKRVEPPEPTDKELIDIWDKAEAQVARGEI